MKRIKKLFFLTLTFILIFSVSASAQAPQKESVTLKISNVIEEGGILSPWYKVLVQSAREKSKGTLNIQVYWNSQLGGEREALEALKLGNIDMQVVTGAVLSVFIPQFKTFELPFLVPSIEAWDKFWRSPIAKEIYASGEKSGIKVLTSSLYSFRFVTNNVRPITKASDFKGIRMRTMQVPMHLDTMKALGASATPIPFPELYTALQTGVVEGQVNPYDVISERKLWEVQKYLSEVPLFISSDHWVVGVKTWNKLSSDHKKLLLDLAREFEPYYEKIGADGENVAKNRALEIGKMKFNKADDLSTFIAAVKPVYDQFLKENPSAAPIVKFFQGK